MGSIELQVVKARDTREIAALYLKGDWWREEQDHRHLTGLIRGGIKTVSPTPLPSPAAAAAETKTAPLKSLF
ncbi:MAG: hypothetical protein U9N40_04320 [Euryarchaeota archaeon]|nr:hypothetical protein [Euryarchaeota archaeon]